MKYGRQGHPKESELKRELFICYLLEKLKAIQGSDKTAKRQRAIAFEALVYGRDDVEELREIIKQRWKK